MVEPSVIRAALAAVVVLMGALIFGLDTPGINVSITMKSTIGAGGEVFFAGAGEGFSQRKSVPFAISADGSWHVYSVVLPADQPIVHIRIDPGNLPGEAAVDSIGIRTGMYRAHLRKQALIQSLGVTNQISLRPDDEHGVAFTSKGNDPYFEVRLPKPVGGFQRTVRYSILGTIALCGFAAWMLLEWLATRLRALTARVTVLPVMLDTAASWVSDEAILRVNRTMLLIAGGVALAATAYVAIGLNQSAIGIWETVYPDHPVEQAIDIGTAKRIRSDEWKVMTPWVLNQIHKGSPLQNPDIGGASSPILASVPIQGVLGLAQVKYVGFHFLGLDRGFSWWWAYKTFALWLSCFWLCLLLTRGRVSASVLGATWIYVSSFTQWWFSSDLPEILTAFALGMIGAIYCLFSARRALIALGCGLVVLAIANFALNLYPPFILTLAYLGVAILLGLAIERDSPGHPRPITRFRVTAIALTTLVVAIYAVDFLTTASDSIAAVVNTVYPGKRLAASGGVPAGKLLYGFFEPFRLGELNFPLPRFNSNACEASSFALLFALAPMAALWQRGSRRKNALLFALAGFCLLSTLWIAVKLPHPADRLLQLAGWSAVTPKRAVLALGIGSILASTVLFSRTLGGHWPMRSLRTRQVLVLVAFVCLAILGWWLHVADPAFFSRRVVVIGLTAGLLLASGILLGTTRLAVAGLAIYALPAMTVNPLQSGISALSEKPVLRAAETYGGSPNDRWIVVGDNFFAQGLRAHGLNVFAGSQYLPDRRSLSVLDPDGTYASIWNRYATVRVLSDPTSKQPRFRLTRGDQYAISLKICDPRLVRLGITRVAYTVEVPPADLSCLRPMPSPRDSGVKLFRLEP